MGQMPHLSNQRDTHSARFRGCRPIVKPCKGRNRSQCLCREMCVTNTTMWEACSRLSLMNQPCCIHKQGVVNSVQQDRRGQFTCFLHQLPRPPRGKRARLAGHRLPRKVSSQHGGTRPQRQDAAERGSYR
jgi:hypothetical protein